MLGVVGTWMTGDVLGLDFETTGIDRFNDVPVSYALVWVVEGVVATSWSGLIDPGRDIPPDAEAVHGISSERARGEGMPLDQAIALVTDAVLCASRRGVPLAGMKLDYDLTMLDTQARHYCGHGLAEYGWRGPVLDVAVLDRQFDPEREGSRRLVDLCECYGIDIGQAHDASADAIASLEVLFALGLRHPVLRWREPAQLHLDQIDWYRNWATRHDDWRLSQGKVALDPRDHVWPVAPEVLPPAA
jgi:DNA polymerase-3 subunit epsilon